MLMVVGCSGASGQGASPRTGPPPASAPAAEEGAAPKEKEHILTEAPREGVITRAELDRYIRDGAQSFIQRIQVRPAFREGKFFGWRVLGYQGPGPVQRGDIICRVNGRSIERPNQFMDVWSGLPHRAQLTVEMIRDGRPLVLRYPIVE